MSISNTKYLSCLSNQNSNCYLSFYLIQNTCTSPMPTLKKLKQNNWKHLAKISLTQSAIIESSWKQCHKKGKNPHDLVTNFSFCHNFSNIRAHEENNFWQPWGKKEKLVKTNDSLFPHHVFNSVSKMFIKSSRCYNIPLPPYQVILKKTTFQVNR